MSVRDGRRSRGPGAMAALALALLLHGPGEAQTAAPTVAPTVATAATLTVLGGRVEHARGAGAPPGPATTGTNLAEGDRVVTGPDGRALVTFLDGSTVTVEPDSDVAVRQAEVGSRERSHLRVLIVAGTVWARLASWLGERATVSLESNVYTATAHDGLIGSQVRADGAFVCWTRAGTLTVTDARGRRQAALRPGQKATLLRGQAAAVEAFAVNQSGLEITVSGSVLPLLLMPDRARVAGFVEPGIEVNQVFGSLTALREDGRRVIDVPAGLPGPYLLGLTGVADGSYTVTVTGRFKGAPAYRVERRGEIRRGERVAAEVSQGVEGAADPRTAKVVAGDMSPLAPATGPAPGIFLLSPLEVSAVRGR